MSIWRTTITVERLEGNEVRQSVSVTHDHIAGGNSRFDNDAMHKSVAKATKVLLAPYPVDLVDGV